MRKILFYAMRGEEMCFMHVLMNALDLTEAGNTVRIIFEGESVKLPAVLEEKKNPLYLQAKEHGLIAGVCRACAVMLEAMEGVEKTGLPILDDMRGHAGMRPFTEEGYEVISF